MDVNTGGWQEFSPDFRLTWVGCQPRGVAWGNPCLPGDPQEIPTQHDLYAKHSSRPASVHIDAHPDLHRLTKQAADAKTSQVAHGYWEEVIEQETKVELQCLSSSHTTAQSPARAPHPLRLD